MGSEESAFLEKPGEDMEVEEDDALAILLNPVDTLFGGTLTGVTSVRVAATTLSMRQSFSS